MNAETKLKIKKLAVGACIAVLGALATYAAEAIPNIDFGGYTPLVTAVLSVGVNALRKFLPILARL